MAVKRKAKFKIGQVVAIRGLAMPLAAAVIVERRDGDVYVIQVEVHGVIDYRATTVGELRPLTDAEMGKASKRKAVKRG